MKKELEDCILDLKDKKYKHIVETYIEEKDFQQSPPEPLTNAQIKYSAYYIFSFDAEYVTYLLNLLHGENLISNPNTNGRFIPDEFAEEIITFLSQYYPEEIILHHKRVYKKYKSNEEVLAIIPTKLEEQYTPSKIKSTKEFLNIINKSSELDAKNAIRLYSFIFYLTLSTQLKDSIYDRTKVVIQVGKKKLKQEANVLIKGQKNWEILLDSFISKIKVADSETRKEVILPKLQQEESLTPIEIKAYRFESRRPPRYGAGRFLTQILEKYNIATNEEHDEIIENLKESGAVKQIEKILYPQKPILELVRWLKEHIPSFLDLEYLAELKSKIEAVSNGELSLSALLQEINELIEAGFASAGYEDIDEPPSEQKIKLVVATAKRHNVSVSNDILSSSAKCDKFLASFPTAEKIKLGRCPKCNANVYQIEHLQESGDAYYSYSCENFNHRGNGCNFSIWDNSLYKFFSVRGYELYTLDEKQEVMKRILSKKQGYLFNDFKKKDKTTYDAWVYVEEYKTPKTSKISWGFQMKYARRKRS
jgi:DNA topoisomerase-1